ncbi:unnamed protein product [Rhizoctonia solani]|uniref:Endo-1,5-alpha-L-arabinanase A n=1 Tax=Rhizoctonia solani TaxID=456999 RepID=A0A8H3AVB5_9AGAM|nr:unnamed protein product [Rhizoctonia solani]
MRFTFSALAVSTISLVSGVLAAFPNPGTLTGSIDVHDPAICRDSAGKYFLFATGRGIPIRTSTDRINWSFVGTVWKPGEPTWTDKYTRKSDGDLWAPDCTYKDGQFYAIDPNLIIDGSNWWLSFGSFWTGIKLVQLGSSTGKPSSSTIYSIAKRTSGGGAVEAPIIVKNGSYYYLFTSWDKCCSGTSSTYNIRVGRSSSITGPYVDQSGVALTSGGGTQILASHGSIIGPGGQHVFKDTGAWVIDYHYYTSSGSLLGINLLDFASGWPVVY